MKRKRYYILSLFLCVAMSLFAQERVVENRPYCDLRPLHFGVIVGANLQDMSLLNCGPHEVLNEDGTTTEYAITCDQDRWDMGFHVGVLGELRLNQYFAFRIAPQMYFGNRHLLFRNFSQLGVDGRPAEERQDMKSAYVTCSLDLIYASKRFNNHRPYVMLGLAPAINLTTKSNDILQLKNTDAFFEAGLGCDLYLPFFKLRPELKFMYSLTNSLNKKHINDITDPNMIKYASTVTSARSKMIALTFYFE